MTDSFASEGLCSFMMEECCCSFSTPVVATCVDYLVAPVGHISSMEAADTDIAGAAVVGIAATAKPGIASTNIAIDAMLAALGTILAALDSEVAVLGPELGTLTGIGDFSLLFVLVGLRPAPCCPRCLQKGNQRSSSFPFPQALRMVSPLCCRGP